MGYKLTYFNGRGRAELARYIFAINDVKYEDVRVEGEAWQKLKPDTPFGQLPLLEVDGVQICQSNAIGRYLARKFGLAGKDDLEAARIDMVVDCCEDCVKPMVAIFIEKDETKKGELKKKYSDEQLPEFLVKFEKLLVANKGGDGYFVGDKLTWADLAVTLNMDWPVAMGMTVPWDKAPKLKSLCDRVNALPKIAAWREKRPKSNF